MTEQIGAALRLLYPDGRAITPDSATDDFSLRSLCEDNVYSLTLTPRRAGLALAAVEYDIPLPHDLTDVPEELYIYDDSAYTNDFTSVVPYVGNETRTVYNLAVFKNLRTRKVFLCGLLTAHRFLAMFNLHDGLVTLRFDLEERELHAGEAYLLERFMVAEGTDNENVLLEAYGRGCRLQWGASG